MVVGGPSDAKCEGRGAPFEASIACVCKAGLLLVIWNLGRSSSALAEYWPPMYVQCTLAFCVAAAAGGPSY